VSAKTSEPVAIAPRRYRELLLANHFHVANSQCRLLITSARSKATLISSMFSGRQGHQTRQRRGKRGIRRGAHTPNGQQASLKYPWESRSRLHRPQAVPPPRQWHGRPGEIGVTHRHGEYGSSPGARRSCRQRTCTFGAASPSFDHAGPDCRAEQATRRIHHPGNPHAVTPLPRCPFSACDGVYDGPPESTAALPFHAVPPVGLEPTLCGF
jgi:hypothetical protein